MSPERLRSLLPRVVDFLIVVSVVASASYIVKLQNRIAVYQHRIQALELQREELSEGASLSALLPRAEASSRFPAIVVFMTDQCQSCISSTPAWRAIAQQIGMQNFFIITPRVNHDPEYRLQEYLKKERLRAAAVISVGASGLQKLRLVGVPRTFLVDTRGIVRKVWRGPLDVDEVMSTWAQMARMKAQGG